MSKIHIKQFFCTVLICLGIITALTSCSAASDEEWTQQGDVLRFSLIEGTVTRAATDGIVMVTTFEQGDRAGLYAVRNGQLVLENVPLTFNVNGFWEAASPIVYSDEYDGVRFYAYYPYQEDAQFDATASSPFDDMVAASVPETNQSTKAAYEASDLMISAASVVGQYNTVTLSMKHQRALVSVQLPNISYIFSNSGIDPYVLSKSEQVAFVLDGVKVQPYFESSSQSYQLIVSPGQAGQLEVSYMNNGGENAFSIGQLQSLQAGQYAKYVVEGGVQLISMTLQEGDYYCADGHIVAKDTPQESLPDNIVGVIFKLGTTDAIKTANANWSHGIVVGLSEARGKWGTNSSTNSEQNAAGWRYWYRDHGLADQGTTSANSLVEDNMAEEGYETTRTWRAVPEPLTIGGITLDYTSEMNTVMNQWIADHPLPASICSGWYIPSLRDLQTLESMSALLSTQLTAVGATDLLWNKGSSDRYWSCNVRGSGSNWCYVGGKSTLNDRYKGVACNGNSFYRFLLAF